ncbi:MAG TPA: flavin reductase [Baekduia sp.]|uniref:flavin reductase n=1 Tax=Baekduia sp. TaxID=2600305 RepID=UPI002D77C055|nr:flavin reductase [Baekduia sp.]HET6509935.1 flavin reductase [Baekduia sp.]
MSAVASRPGFDAQTFRQVLGHYPTGVCVVTAIVGGRPAGMAVGSFTSVSLDPPLVAFLPDRSSTSFPKIRAAGSFCVNVLGADQEDVCRALAAKVEDKFRDVPWAAGPSGSPVLDGAVAWIDCDLESVAEAGDHYIVLGRVRDLDVHQGSLPLLFFKGGYGSFTQPSRAAVAEFDLVAQLRLVDLARGPMQRLADELRVEVLAVSLVGEDLVVLGSAGEPRLRPEPTRLGQRIPHIPPIGGVFVAWADEPEVDAWLARAPEPSPERDAVLRAGLERVRSRGWSIAVDHPRVREVEAAVFRHGDGPDRNRSLVADVLSSVVGSYEPAAFDGLTAPSNIMAPVRDAGGGVPLALALYGLPDAMGATEVAGFAERLTSAAAAIGAVLPPA